MILMVKFYYASHVAEKLKDIALKMPKLPDYVKKWLIFHATSERGGFKQINIIYIEQGHADTALIEIPKMLKPLWERDDIEPKMEFLYGVKDTMKLFL